MLVVCGCAGIAVGASASEPGTRHRSTAGVAVYSNDDGLRVISPSTTVRQHVSEKLSVDGGLKSDIISGATVDVITAATSAIRERRYEGRLGLSGDFGRVRASGGYTASIEQDTHTQLFDVVGELGLLERNVTLRLGLAVGLDRIGLRRLSTDLWQDRQTVRLDAGLTQLIDRRTVFGASYTGQYQHGLLSSLYRRVPLFPRDEALRTLGNVQWTAERHPEARLRHALTLLGRRALGSSFFASARWRGYLDTWAMRSHEGELGLGVDLGHGVQLEAAERLYWQSRVSFYRSVYTVNRRYVTRDRRLGGMLTGSTRLDLRWIGARLELLARGALRWSRYDDFLVPVAGSFEPFTETMAVIVQLGVGLTL